MRRSKPFTGADSEAIVTRFPLIPLLNYLQHRWRSPSYPAPTGIGVCPHGRVRRLFHACIRSTTFGNNSGSRELRFKKPIAAARRLACVS